MPDADHVQSSDRAMQMAEVYGHEVLDDSQTTETDRVWAQPTGSWRLESYTQPVRVDRNDQWIPVDDTLVQQGASISPTATTHAMRFSAGGDGAMASLQAANGQWLSVTSPFGALPTPTLDGDTATYADVLPDVDLRLSANPSGFSEVLVVKTAAAAASAPLTALNFGISDGTMTSEPTPGGGLVTSSQDGTVLIQEGQPTWWDSSIRGADADGPADSGVARPLPGASSNSSSVNIDVSQIEHASNPVYPLFVDPSWNGGTRYAWTYTDNAYPDQSYYNGANLGSDQSAHVGFIDAAHAYDDGRNHVTRSLFLMHSYGVAGKHVINAQFNAHLLYSSTCTPTAVTARTVGTFGSGTTWNNQPALGQVQQSKDGAFRSECQQGSTSGYLSMGFNVTQLLTAAAASSAAKVGIALQGTENDWTSWKKFDNNPSLAVTYNTPPGQPAGRSVKPCYAACAAPVQTSSNRPTLSAQTTDADAGAQLRYDFEIWRGWAANPTSKATGGSPKSRPQNTLATWAPATALADGQYEYRVRAFDLTDYGPWSNGWVTFTIDTSAPAPPDAFITGATTDPEVDQGDVEGVVGAPIGLSFATTQDASMYEIAYSLYGEVPNYTTAPACGTVSDTVVVVCRSGGNFPANLKIAALDKSTTLSLIGFDAAGNVSSSKGSIQLFVNDADYSATAAHSWRIATGTTGSIPDAATANTQSLTEGTGVGRATDTPNPAVSGTDPLTGEPIETDVPVSTFHAQGAAKTTATALLDMSKSFTFTAWVDPTDTDADNPSGTNAFAVMSQEGPKISGAFIDAYRNNWRFCMPSTQRTDSAFDGVCAQVSGVAVGQWSFLVAQWDAVNKQVRLTVGAGGGDTAVRSHPTTAAASGVFNVGVRNQPGQVYPFYGRIFYPTAAQLIASSSQLNNLALYKPMTEA